MMESCAHKFKMHLQLKMEMFEAGQGNNLQQWRRNLGDYLKNKVSLPFKYFNNGAKHYDVYSDISNKISSWSLWKNFMPNNILFYTN